MILLNPGPVTLSERVKDALLKPDICHREPEFFDMQSEIRQGLVDVYGLDEAWCSVLVSGSGTCAVEAMISSLVPADGGLLVIENGVYGERITDIARVHGINVVPVHFEWGEEIDPARVEAALVAADGITHLAAIHHETTTGRLNDLTGIGEICIKHGVGMLLDGVSSFGGEALDWEGWGIVACAATANKCVHGIPGLAFVVCRRDALATACEPPRTLYLDLPTYCAKQDERGTPFTPAVYCYYALQEALLELADQGGWQARHGRYCELAERVRAGLAGLGIEAYTPAEVSSAVLRSYDLPEGVTYELLHDGLKKAGFVIYAGQAGLKERIFRISTMGAITDEDVDRLIAAFADILSA